MNLTYNGLNEAVATFSCSPSLQVGDVVTLSGNGVVAKAGADKDFVGVCVSKNGTIAGVMVCGVAEITYNDTSPATTPIVGFSKLKTSGLNKIKVLDAGRECLILSVDTTNKKATVLM